MSSFPVYSWGKPPCFSSRHLTCILLAQYSGAAAQQPPRHSAFSSNSCYCIIPCRPSLCQVLIYILSLSFRHYGSFLCKHLPNGHQEHVISPEPARPSGGTYSEWHRGRSHPPATDDECAREGCSSDQGARCHRRTRAREYEAGLGTPTRPKVCKASLSQPSSWRVHDFDS